MSASSISVIIPALNEAHGIEGTLTNVSEQLDAGEIIVADGGSSDDTIAVAARYAHVVSAPPGRALQMNAGAAAARGEVFLFLHADTLLPPGALCAIRNALADPLVVGGNFRLRFDHPAAIMRIYASFTRFRWKRLCFGDRALFVRRAAFDRLGGFPPIPIFEDLELAAKLHAEGRFAYLAMPVTTAARRFERHGMLRQQLRNMYLWFRYVLGHEPNVLAEFYRYD